MCGVSCTNVNVDISVSTNKYNKISFCRSL